jgi:N-acetylglucosaminyl-diphospho-decaprenol L-rhamnosyltransferase
MEPKATRSPVSAQTQGVRVSAIVVARDLNGASLDHCLRSVLNDPWVDETIVVDIGLPAEAASWLRSLRADRRDVSLVRGVVNTGFAAGCNLGAQLARGRWLLFVHSDVILMKGAVARLVAAGRTAESPWIVGARVVDAHGREKSGARADLPTLASAMAQACGLNVNQPHRTPEKPIPVPSVSGAAMLIPREDFAALGGFATDALEPFEAVDLCRRAGAAGGQVRFAPKAEALQYAAPAGRRFSQTARTGRGVSRFLAHTASTPGRKLAAAFAAPLLRMLWGLRGLAALLFGGR